MVRLTAEEMTYMSSLMALHYEYTIDKHALSEAKLDVINKIKQLHEQIEKKYNIQIEKVDKVLSDGTLVFKN